MPSPKINHRKGSGGYKEKNKNGRLSEKASSFHGRSGGDAVAEMLTRPRTVPDLLAWRRSSPEEVAAPPPKLSKFLLNVTVQRSPGAVQVLMPPEATVGELIAAVLRQYGKEARRPVISSGGGCGFDLHYSQFSLESLDSEEKLMSLGSRNFFLCPKKAMEDVTESAPTCSKEADNYVTEKKLSWPKFMHLLL